MICAIVKQTIYEIEILYTEGSSYKPKLSLKTVVAENCKTKEYADAGCEIYINVP